MLNIGLNRLVEELFQEAPLMTIEKRVQLLFEQGSTTTFEENDIDLLSRYDIFESEQSTTSSVEVQVFANVSPQRNSNTRRDSPRNLNIPQFRRLIFSPSVPLVYCNRYI